MEVPEAEEGLPDLPAFNIQEIFLYYPSLREIRDFNTSSPIFNRLLRELSAIFLGETSIDMSGVLSYF